MEVCEIVLPFCSTHAVGVTFVADYELPVVVLMELVEKFPIRGKE